MSDWWQADPIAGAPQSKATVTPVQKAFLNSVAAGESPDYNTVYGGGRFEEMRDHPRQNIPIRSGPNAGRTSSAAGRYQFLQGTWDEAKNALNLPDFSPDSQDAAGAWLAARDYQKRTGRDLWKDVEDAKSDPNRLNVIGGALSGTWTSLPGGIEPNRASGGFGQRMASELSAQSKQQQQPMNILPDAAKANWWANDPVAQQPQADVPLPRPAPGEMQGPPQAPVSLVQKAIEPITSYPSTQSQMAHESYDQMAKGAGQVKDAIVGEYNPSKLLSGIGNAAMGGLGYVTSPVNAALRTIAGKPIEENTGIPKEYTEAALGFVLPVPGTTANKIKSTLVPRELSAGEKVIQAGDNLANVGTSGAVSIPRAVASDSMVAQRAAAVAGNVPLAGDPIVKAAQGTTKQLATKAQEVAQEYGAANPITAGEEASGVIKNWITGTSKQKVSEAYNKVDSLVDNTIRTDLTQTRQTAQEILSRRANANISDKSDAVRRVEEAITNPQGLNYQGVKDLRTYMGELVDGKRILPADLSEAEVKQIYGALSKDLRTTVENAGGPKALGAFERANKYNQLVADRRESLAKIVGANGDAPAAQVFDRLVGMAGNTTRADMAKLAEARKAMGPDAWNEIASGVISRMGQVQDATGNVIFSPQRFLTSLNKLSEPGRAMMFRSAGKENLAPFLDDIATISARFKELQKFSNPSGTAQNLMGGAMFTGLLAEPVTAITSVVGGNIMARVLAQPATVAPTAQWMRKYEIVARAPTPANVAQLTIASRNLANTINAELGTNVNWTDFLKAVQGPVKGRAEDEQPKPERVVN